MDDTERRRTAPNLVTFVMLPLRNDAREVAAGRSRQSCSLEVFRDAPDIAGIDRGSHHVNERLRLARLWNRNFFDL